MILRDRPPSTKLGDVSRVGSRTTHSFLGYARDTGPISEIGV